MKTNQEKQDVKLHMIDDESQLGNFSDEEKELLSGTGTPVSVY